MLRFPVQMNFSRISNHKTKNIIGTAAVLLAAVSFGTVQLFIKGSAEGDLPLTCWLCYRYGMGALMALAAGLCSRSIKKIEFADFGRLSLIGITTFAGTTVLMFMAYEVLPVSIVMTVNYSYPVVVALFMILVFHEKGTVLKSLAIILCSASVLLITLTAGDLDRRGLLLACFSSLTFAAYMILIEKSRFRQMNSIAIIFYMWSGVSIFYCICALLRGELVMFADSVQLSNCFFSSFFGVLGCILLTLGTSLIGASTASFIALLELVTSVALDLFVLHTHLKVAFLLGTLLMLFSAILISIDKIRE